MVSRRSLRSILSNAKISDQSKEIIQKKLKVITSFSNENDSQPMDFYRYLGQQTIRLQLIKELNKFINDQTNHYQTIIVWSSELWNLKENCEKLISLTNEMLRSLIHNGDISGFYDTNNDKEKSNN